MEFSPQLIPATLLRRYQRFLADVVLANGEPLTVHCPNTGSMKNCWAEGDTVWLADSNNSKRKYRYTWQFTQDSQNHWIGINTHLTNKLVDEALIAGQVPELADYQQIAREVKYGEENSRIDFLLTGLPDNPEAQCYLEVKNVTLRETDGIGYFPDAVTTRGQKHLRELAQMVENGHRAMLLFCVQHSAINVVKPAQHIDPSYAKLLAEAVSRGVEVLAWQAEMSEKSAFLARPVAFNQALDSV